MSAGKGPHQNHSLVVFTFPRRLPQDMLEGIRQLHVEARRLVINLAGLLALPISERLPTLEPGSDMAVQRFSCMSRIGTTVAGQLPTIQMRPKPPGVRNSLFIPI